MEDLPSAGAYIFFDELRSLDWPTLENNTGLTFTESQRTQLLKAVNGYLYGFIGRRQLPQSIRDVRERRQQIKTHAYQLRTLLFDPSPTGEYVLNSVFPFDVADPGVLYHILNELLFNIAKHEQEYPLSGKPGRTPNNDLPLLIRRSYEVYRQAGGTVTGYCYWSPDNNQYCGPFLDLLESVLSELNARLSSSPFTTKKAPNLIPFARNSLGKAILRSRLPKS
jgi:hypothetical protein